MTRLLVRLFCGLFVGGALLCASPAVRAEGDAHGHAAAEEGDHSKPTPPMNFQSDLALWSAVTFLVFLFVLKKLAWQPLNAALDQREARIRQDLNDAEAARHKAEAMLREHEAKLAKVQEEVKEILAEARRDAEHTKQEIVATAQREAEATRQRALTDIHHAKDVAISELFDFVSANVLQATERVLQRSLTGDDQERLVREALSELNVRRN